MIKTTEITDTNDALFGKYVHVVFDENVKVTSVTISDNEAPIEQDVEFLKAHITYINLMLSQ